MKPRYDLLFLSLQAQFSPPFQKTMSDIITETSKVILYFVRVLCESELNASSGFSAKYPILNRIWNILETYPVQDFWERKLARYGKH